MKNSIINNYKKILLNIITTLLVWSIVWSIIIFIILKDLEVIPAGLLITIFTLPSIILYFISNFTDKLKKYKNLAFILPVSFILIPLLFWYIALLLGYISEWEWSGLYSIMFIGLLWSSIAEYIFIKKILK